MLLKSLRISAKSSFWSWPVRSRPFAQSGRFCVVTAAFCVHGLSAAQDAENLPLWELGAFGVGVSQQAYPGSDQNVTRALALPFAIYRGQFLRADRQTAGLRAIKTERFELDIGFAGSFGASSDVIDARRGMPDLGALVEFGPRVKWNLGQGPGGGRWRLELPLRAVFDLSDGLARRGATFEPELAFERRAHAGWTYSTSVSAILADRRLADTFYGVGPIYATAERPAYVARSGLVSWRLSGSFTRTLSPDWRLFGFGRIDSVSGAANTASPLVRRNAGATVGAGVAYTWMRSERRAVD
jgi:outer membrane scaffolding protein for murein synthesis (MipA/OmpV family)